MRILHVISALSPRQGGPSNLLGLTRALARQGCDVSVYTTDLDEQGTVVPWRQPRRLSVPLGLPVADGGATVRYFRADWPSRFACSWHLAGALRRDVRGFDMVHIHSLYLFHGLVAAHYCRRWSIPYVIRPHGTLTTYQRRHHRGRKALYDRLIERRNIAGAAAIHYTSRAEAEQAQQAGVSVPGFVVGLGVDLAEYADLPAHGQFRAGHPETLGRRLVVFLGRITPKKGFDLLMPALARVASTMPDVHLVLAGPDNEGYAATVRDLVRQSGLGPRVTWTGLVTGHEKLSLLRDADLWVLPSYDENFAIAAVEAMAAGAPIVITDRVGIHEAVRAAEAGIVVRPTVDDVADGIAALLGDQGRRQTMGSNARRLALSEFSWDTSAARLVRQYQVILGGVSTAPASGEGGLSCEAIR